MDSSTAHMQLILDTITGGSMKQTVIDRIIGIISPKAGVERIRWRRYYEEQRGNYDASDSGRLQSRWNTQNQSAELTDRFERDTIRARTRDLERNSDILNSVIRAFRRNVIGGGLQIRVTTDQADQNKILETAWKRWCEKENCDVTGTQSFTQIVRMLIQRKIVDGGILIIKRYTSQGYLPFQLQILEVDELDSTQIQPKEKDNKVVGGIEYNRWNRPVGYWITQYEIDGYTRMKPVYVPAKDVIFYYAKRRPSQIREMTDLAPTVTRIKDMNEFISAVTIKEKIAACLAILVKRVNNLVSNRGRDGKPQSEISYEGKRIVPGMILEMNPGDDAQTVTPPGQGSDAATFLKAEQRLISSASGLSYEATARDMSETNYSSARQSGIEDDLTYDEEKELLFQVLDEIYETFVISCWLKGIISGSDFWNNIRDYTAHEWVVKPKRWIDPAKEANANATMLKTGQKTFQQICAENGRDWKQVIDEMDEANRYAAEKNIDLAAMLAGGPGTQEPEEEEGKKNGTKTDA